MLSALGAFSGAGGGERMAREYGVDVLGSLSLKLQIREQTDSGRPHRRRRSRWRHREDLQANPALNRGEDRRTPERYEFEISAYRDSENLAINLA